ncbi:MAG: YCF48-related protein [Desulfobacteraceae bacterium]
MRLAVFAGVLLIVATLLLGGGPVSAQRPLVLERPSLLSDKAAGAAILAVTRAGDRLVAVGERGIVLLSDDSGRSWRQVVTPVRVSLATVTFVGEKKGWAAGHLGVILHTEDGGESWVKQFDGTQAAALALAAAEQRAAAEPDPEKREDILFSAQRLMEDGPDKPFLDLCFLDEQTGFVVGAFNLIFRTTDGGATWTPWQDRVVNPMELHFYGIQNTGETFYIAGEQGTLLRSTDGGAHFTALASPYEGSFFGLVTDPGGNVVVFGLRGNVFHSNDKGESWDRVKTGIPVSLSAGIRLADGKVALVSQAGDLLLSNDGGQSFEPQPDGQPIPATGIVQTAAP